VEISNLSQYQGHRFVGVEMSSLSQDLGQTVGDGGFISSMNLTWGISSLQSARKRAFFNTDLNDLVE
jgi:hypothetical protein